jgi:small subunit ribosomal protein S19
MPKENNDNKNVRHKKPPYIRAEDIENFKEFLRTGAKKPIKMSRRSTIVPQMVGHTFLVHNGQKYTPIEIRKEHVNLKFGSLVASKKFHKHGGKKEGK